MFTPDISNNIETAIDTAYLALLLLLFLLLGDFPTTAIAIGISKGVFQLRLLVLLRQSKNYCS